MREPEDYELLLKQLEAITGDEPDALANFANISAVLFEALADTNWCGWYPPSIDTSGYTLSRLRNAQSYPPARMEKWHRRRTSRSSSGSALARTSSPLLGLDVPMNARRRGPGDVSGSQGFWS